MALLLLLSTVSWTVNTHKCMGRTMDVAVFSKAKGCGMEEALLAIEASEENHCCDNESFTVKGQDDLRLSLSDISFDQQLFLVAYATSFFYLKDNTEKNLLSDDCYPPPPLIKDIQLLDEVFLI